MPKRNIGLTQLEKKNPLGALSEGMTSEQVIEKLKEIDFLTDDLKLTRRGTEYVHGKLAKLDNVERIMIELFTLAHHGAEPPKNYRDKEADTIN